MVFSAPTRFWSATAYRMVAQRFLFSCLDQEKTAGALYKNFYLNFQTFPASETGFDCRIGLKNMFPKLWKTFPQKITSGRFILKKQLFEHFEKCSLNVSSSSFECIVIFVIFFFHHPCSFMVYYYLCDIFNLENIYYFPSGSGGPDLTPSLLHSFTPSLHHFPLDI